MVKKEKKRGRKGHNVKWIVSSNNRKREGKKKEESRWRRTCYQFLRMVEHITPVIESQTYYFRQLDRECVCTIPPFAPPPPTSLSLCCLGWSLLTALAVPLPQQLSYCRRPSSSVCFRTSQRARNNPTIGSAGRCVYGHESTGEERKNEILINVYIYKI